MPEAALQPLNLVPACVNQGAPAIPAAGSVGRAIVQRVSCGDTVMTIEIEMFSSRSTAAPVNAELRRLTRAPDADDLSEAPVLTQSGAALPGWRFIRANDTGFVAASGLWIDGRPARPGLRMRLRMAQSSVFGGSYAPVLVVITPVADWRQVDVSGRHKLERQIAAVLAAHSDIGDQLRAAARDVR
jgi:hypothetical protein